MTIALGVAKWLVESRWPEEGRGELLFVFQPAEEGGAGARAMLESGAFDPTSVAARLPGTCSRSSRWGISVSLRG